MKAFMTNGTYDFLKKRTEKYKTIPFFFMQGNGGTVAYYENIDKNIFSAGRAYTVDFHEGDIQKQGYIDMQYISIFDEHAALFQEHAHKMLDGVKDMPGFLAFRSLKPKKGQKRVIFVQWESARYYQNWKEQVKDMSTDASIMSPAFAADKPFTATYTMVKDM